MKNTFFEEIKEITIRHKSASSISQDQLESLWLEWQPLIRAAALKGETSVDIQECPAPMYTGDWDVDHISYVRLRKFIKEKGFSIGFPEPLYPDDEWAIICWNICDKE